MENKPGACGNLGTDAVAKATPDGSTLGVSIGGPLAINTLLFARLPYDPGKDIAPITQLITQPSVLAVNPNLGVNSVAELVALLKNNPGKYNFASIGKGSLSQRRADGLPSGDIGDATGNIRSSKNSRRLYRQALILFARPADLEGSRHRCRSRRLERPAPGGRPKPIIDKISKDVAEIINQPAVREKLAAQLMEPVVSSPEDLRARMDGEIARWAPVIKAANVILN